MRLALRQFVGRVSENVVRVAKPVGRPTEHSQALIEAGLLSVLPKVLAAAPSAAKEDSEMMRDVADVLHNLVCDSDKVRSMVLHEIGTHRCAWDARASHVQARCVFWRPGPTCLWKRQRRCCVRLGCVYHTTLTTRRNRRRTRWGARRTTCWTLSLSRRPKRFAECKIMRCAVCGHANPTTQACVQSTLVAAEILSRLTAHSGNRQADLQRRAHALIRPPMELHMKLPEAVAMLRLVALD